jgi:hypothetical protein
MKYKETDMAGDIVLSNVHDVLSSHELASILPAELDDSEALLVWSLFDALEKELVAKRKNVFRDHLLQLAEEKGEVNPKGSKVYQPAGSDGKITKQFRKGKPSIDPDMAMRFLEERKLDGKLLETQLSFSKDEVQLLLDALDRQMSTALKQDPENPRFFKLQSLRTKCELTEYAVDEKRLEAAVTMGLVSLEELREISDPGRPTYALVVKKPSAVTRLVKEGKR